MALSYCSGWPVWDAGFGYQCTMAGSGSLAQHREGLRRALPWEQQAQWEEFWSRHHGTNPGDSIGGLRQDSTPLWTSKVLSTTSTSLLAFLGPGSPKIIFFHYYLYSSSLGLQLQSLAGPLLHLHRTLLGQWWEEHQAARAYGINAGSSSWQTCDWWVT